MLDSTRRGFLKALGLSSLAASVPAVQAVAAMGEEKQEEEFSEEEIAQLRSIIEQMEVERIDGRRLFEVMGCFQDGVLNLCIGDDVPGIPDGPIAMNVYVQKVSNGCLDAVGVQHRADE
jgi:hypothetical protein